MRSSRLLTTAAALLCAGALAVATPATAVASVAPAPAGAVTAAPATNLTAVHGTGTPARGTDPAWAHETVPGAPQSYATSGNWAGYVATAGSYGAAQGTFVVPTPTCTGSNTFSAFWVGLNGWTNGTVQQFGISADCVSGAPDYFAWWEMYPSPANDLSETAYPVRPGDHITATVLDNIGIFALKMTSSRGWSLFVNASGPTSIVSAEWIAEAPTGAFITLPLGDFGTVAFTNCTTNTSTPINAAAYQSIEMVLYKRMPSGETGTLIEAEPSALTAGGTAFAVTSFPDGHRYQL